MNSSPYTVRNNSNLKAFSAPEKNKKKNKKKKTIKYLRIFVR